MRVSYGRHRLLVLAAVGLSLALQACRTWQPSPVEKSLVVVSIYTDSDLRDVAVTIDDAFSFRGAVPQSPVSYPSQVAGVRLPRGEHQATISLLGAKKQVERRTFNAASEFVTIDVRVYEGELKVEIVPNQVVWE